MMALDSPLFSHTNVWSLVLYGMFYLLTVLILWDHHTLAMTALLLLCVYLVLVATFLLLFAVLRICCVCFDDTWLDDALSSRRHS